MMKTQLLAIVTSLALLFSSQAQESPLREALQNGLTEEEINQDIAAAVKHYESMRDQYDGARKLAATGIYRLGECYRKLGDEKKAIAQFQRIVKEFSDIENLARLSTENLVTLGVTPEGTGAAPGVPAGMTDAEAKAFAEVKQLVKDSPDLINARDTAPLLSAAGNSHLVLANYLLDNGADADVMGKKGPPIVEAVTGGHLAMVKLLAERGAKLDGWKGSSALDWAIGENRLEVARYLVGKGGKASGSAFKMLCKNRSGKMAEEMLPIIVKQEGFDVNAIDPATKKTPLGLALAHANLGVAKQLIAAGADVNGLDRNTADDKKSWTLLSKAVDMGNLEFVELLLENGADPNRLSYRGFAAIHFAVSTRNGRSALPTLIAKKVDLEVKTADGLTALDLAVSYGLDETKRLVEAGASLAGGEEGTSVLHRAAGVFSDTTSYLISKGADLKARDKKGRTPLLAFADMAGQLSLSGSNDEARALHTLEILLKAGSEINDQDAEGKTALHLIRLWRHKGTSFIKRLLEAKPDPTILSKSGEPALDPDYPYGVPFSEALRYFKERRPNLESAIWLEPHNRPGVGSGGFNSGKIVEPIRTSRPASAAIGSEAMNLCQFLAEHQYHTVDFRRVTITRRSGKTNAPESIVVNLAELAIAGDLTKVPVLRWGDIVEVYYERINRHHYRPHLDFHWEAAKIDVRLDFLGKQRDYTLSFQDEGIREPSRRTLGSIETGTLGRFLSRSGATLHPLADPSKITIRREIDGSMKEIAVAPDAVETTLLLDGDVIAMGQFAADSDEAKERRSKAIWVSRLKDDFMMPIVEKKSGAIIDGLVVFDAVMESLGSRAMVLPFPDLNSLKLHRLAEGAPDEILPVQMLALDDSALTSGVLSVRGVVTNGVRGDTIVAGRRVRWGDILEIPAQENTDDFTTWTGLDDAVVEQLSEFAPRSLTVQVDGVGTNQQLPARQLSIIAPLMSYQFSEQKGWAAKDASQRWPNHAQVIAESLKLKAVLEAASYKSSHYDLRIVQVTRRIGERDVHHHYDLTRTSAPIWLRSFDQIKFSILPTPTAPVEKKSGTRTPGGRRVILPPSQ